MKETLLRTLVGSTKKYKLNSEWAEVEKVTIQELRALLTLNTVGLTVTTKVFAYTEFLLYLRRVGAASYFEANVYKQFEETVGGREKLTYALVRAAKDKDKYYEAVKQHLASCHSQDRKGMIKFVCKKIIQRERDNVFKGLLTISEINT